MITAEIKQNGICKGCKMMSLAVKQTKMYSGDELIESVNDIYCEKYSICKAIAERLKAGE